MGSINGISVNPFPHKTALRQLFAQKCISHISAPRHPFWTIQSVWHLEPGTEWKGAYRVLFDEGAVAAEAIFLYFRF